MSRTTTNARLANARLANARTPKSALWVLSLGLLFGAPTFTSVATAAPAPYHGELARAQHELDHADRAWRCSVDELNRARVALDAARGNQARLAAQVDSIARTIPGLRHNADAASVALQRAQGQLARAQADEANLKQQIAVGEQRVAGARQYAEGVRAKLIADFENGRELYHANAELASATARLEQAKNAVVGYVETTRQGRWIRSEIRRLEEEIGYLRASRPVDYRRVQAAERALADARRDMDQLIGNALATDLAVREANIAVAVATNRINELRQCFERDLPRRRELANAYAAIEQEERALAGSRAQLADVCRQAEALRAEVDKHNACAAEAVRRLQCAEADLARATHDLNGAAGVVVAADVQVRRATEAECATRAARDRAATRVAFLDRRLDDAPRGPRFDINVRWESNGHGHANGHGHGNSHWDRDRRDDRDDRRDNRERRADVRDNNDRDDRRDARDPRNGDSGIRDRRDNVREPQWDNFRQVSISRR